MGFAAGFSAGYSAVADAQERREKKKQAEEAALLKKQKEIQDRNNTLATDTEKSLSKAGDLKLKHEEAKQDIMTSDKYATEEDRVQALNNVNRVYGAEIKRYQESAGMKTQQITDEKLFKPLVEQLQGIQAGADFTNYSKVEIGDKSTFVSEAEYEQILENPNQFTIGKDRNVYVADKDGASTNQLFAQGKSFKGAVKEEKKGMPIYDAKTGAVSYTFSNDEYNNKLRTGKFLHTPPSEKKESKGKSVMSGKTGNYSTREKIDDEKLVAAIGFDDAGWFGSLVDGWNQRKIGDLGYAVANMQGSDGKPLGEQGAVQLMKKMKQWELGWDDFNSDKLKKVAGVDSSLVANLEEAMTLINNDNYGGTINVDGESLILDRTEMAEWQEIQANKNNKSSSVSTTEDETVNDVKITSKERNQIIKDMTNSERRKFGRLNQKEKEEYLKSKLKR